MSSVTDSDWLQTNCRSCLMTTDSSCSGSQLIEPLTPNPRISTCWSQRSRIILQSPEYMPLLQKDVNRLRMSGNGYLRGDVGKRRRGVRSRSMSLTSVFDAAPSASLFALPWLASPRHAIYSNTAHRSSAVSTFVFDTSWANSTSDIVGNRMWNRTDPRTRRWFSGVTSIPWRWHSLPLHARQAWNTDSSLTDMLENCMILSSVLSATSNHTAHCSDNLHGPQSVMGAAQYAHI